MTGDQKAERFMFTLLALLALSLVLTYHDAVAASARAPFFSLSVTMLFDGGLCYLVLERNKVARIILGILLLLPATFAFGLHLSNAQEVPGLVLCRNAVIAVFAVALLCWRPIRDYTRTSGKA